MGSSQLIGSITEYNSSRDDWNVYHERLEQFFEVNDISEEKRSAFLISVIGAEAYKSLRDLCHPALPKDKPFADLCELLRKQFSPQIAIFRERVKFYNARQDPNENVTQWYGKLKRLSVDCKFASNLESVLLDKFITGLRPGQVLDRLCEENEKLKLELALDIAVNKECAAKDNAYLPFAPRPTQCYFGGEPVRTTFAPPAQIRFKSQPFGSHGGTGQLFGGSASTTQAFSAPVEVLRQPLVLDSQPCEPQKLFFSAPAQAAPAVGLFGAASSAPEPEEQIVGEGASAPALGCLKSADVPLEQEEDGVPEGADRAGAPVTKAKRVRTRRRGAARRVAGGDGGDKNSVDGE
ncbi:uncharacterized protein LOC134214465 [Armigeres subalbatus]|uniref:uncharacterized protein LOC134214465 n=1 Tax=Armigeres subalbatus TaxID=124917 RepID=UPI002ED16172